MTSLKAREIAACFIYLIGGRAVRANHSGFISFFYLVGQKYTVMAKRKHREEAPATVQDTVSKESDESGSEDVMRFELMA